MQVTPKSRPGTKEFDYTKLNFLRCGSCGSGIKPDLPDAAGGWGRCLLRSGYEFGYGHRSRTSRLHRGDDETTVNCELIGIAQFEKLLSDLGIDGDLVTKLNTITESQNK